MLQTKQTDFFQKQLLGLTDTSDFMQFYMQNVHLFTQHVRESYSSINERMRNGRAMVGSYRDLISYMVLWGGFLYQCYDDISQEIMNWPELALDEHRPLHLVDYACGQGSASLVMLERLKEQYPQLKNIHITLVEPSPFSLERAEQLLCTKADQLGITLNIESYCHDFNQLPEDFLDSAADKQVFHLFNNILDLYYEGHFDLIKLTRRIKALPATHTVIAMSTKHPRSFRSDDSLGIREFHALTEPSKLLYAGNVVVENVQYYKHRYNDRCMVTEDKKMMVYVSQW